VIVDANVLISAVNEDAARHRVARAWLEDALNGDVRVGLPWPSLLAFLRLTTHARVTPRPLHPEQAWQIVASWLAAPAAWLPQPTSRHLAILGALVQRYGTAGNLVPDAHLAALAIEHGVPVISTDSDFARFREVRWENPLG
jgi:toxin-antitoxin system PIN domain toxin